MTRRWLDPSFFVDEKLKKGSITERYLAAALIANQDDDGRLTGDPSYLRSIAFLYDDVTLQQVAEWRDHLVEINKNIILYQVDGDDYIQLTKYKRYQNPRYYHPSKLPAPPGWLPLNDNSDTDTEQQPSNNRAAVTTVTMGKGRGKGRGGGEGRGKGLDLGEGEGRGKGLGKGIESPSPSLTGETLLGVLNEKYLYAFGRKPDSGDTKYLTDLGLEISAAGGATLEQVHDAFKEAAIHNKLYVSYVRKILRVWIDGDHRENSP